MSFARQNLHSMSSLAYEQVLTCVKSPFLLALPRVDKRAISRELSNHLSLACTFARPGPSMKTLIFSQNGKCAFKGRLQVCPTPKCYGVCRGYSVCYREALFPTVKHHVQQGNVFVLCAHLPRNVGSAAVLPRHRRYIGIRRLARKQVI